MRKIIRENFDRCLENIDKVSGKALDELVKLAEKMLNICNAFKNSSEEIPIFQVDHRTLNVPANKKRKQKSGLLLGSNCATFSSKKKFAAEMEPKLEQL